MEKIQLLKKISILVNQKKPIYFLIFKHSTNIKSKIKNKNKFVNANFCLSLFLRKLKKFKPQ